MSHFVRAAATRLALLIAVSFALVCLFLTSNTVTASQSPSQSVETATRDATGTREWTRYNQHSGENRADGVVDLYGNDVSDAVAEYTLDAAGSLYEVHSPRTELVHLASPKT
jgi:HAMP domain-containing protein